MADDPIERWVRPEIRALSAYHVPEAAGLIKLDAMENPYTWPEALRREWAAVMEGVDVNRYPDPQATALKARLREAWPVPEGAALLLGNGSDEIIQMIALTLAAPGSCILSVEPGFVMYRMIAAYASMDYHGVPLRGEDFGLDMPALLEAVARLRPSVIFVACPNNPTGNLFDPAQVRALIEAAPGLVVVDEAYAPFTDASFLPEVGRWPNLVVMRTVSKMGLAGLRLGVLAGPAAWVEEIDKVRLPYNINTLTQVSADFALRHKAVFDDQTRCIRADRTALFDALRGIDGLHPWPSEANFILVRGPRGCAGEIHHRLQAEAGILVKNLHGAHPLLADCLRLTVGTPEENAALIDALKRIVA